MSDKLSYKKSTFIHRTHVDLLMGNVANEIRKRGKLHDVSKLSGIEASFGEMYYEDYTKINKPLALEPDIAKYNEEMAPAFVEHSKRNDHHIEHFKNGLSDMNILQITEFLCDNLAHMREKGYVKYECVEKIEFLLKSHGASDDLVSIAKNTIEHLYEED